MFPSAIRKEISVGMKQIFIAYKVADAKYIFNHIGSMPVY